MDIRDQHNQIIDINHVENEEQDLARQYIEENSVVLELGARYGSVSCTINSKLADKTRQVVVEPDGRVWDILERNRDVNNCEFHIVKGFISNKKLDLTNLDVCNNGYAATYIENENTLIPSFSLEEIENLYNLNFNTLVADCEGFLEVFFDENPKMYDQLILIIFEEDYGDKCDYNKIRSKLNEKGFKQIKGGFQNVWKK